MTDERTTRSGIPLRVAYGPDDVPLGAAESSRSRPGDPPFVRGAYPAMYRSRPWRIFQLSGYGNPEDERERILFLLEQGETGFLMEHDRMTADHLYNVDHPEVVARREDVGLSGAVILGARDYETILNGIPIDHHYVHPGGAVVQHAPFALSCYWTVAHRRGLDLSTLAGTGQSDFFLTYLGCIPKQQIPATDGMRMNCDIIEFCAEQLPRWIPVSVAGYNAADTGLSGPEEVGAVMANAVAYLDAVLERGRLPIEQFAHSVGGINLRVSMDLFEEIAKLRAARKMWHDLLRSRYGIADERALRLRIHVVTAGSAMTYQQPLNNVARGTLMALASVLGGVQSLGVSGYDEALSIPSEHAHQMSVRIQQILQNETNLTSVADPLGGSWFVESLTAEVEERAWEFFTEIERQGGFVPALDSGWLHEVAARHQAEELRAIDAGEQVIVGVNGFTEDVSPFEVGGFAGPDDVWDRAMARLADIRATRGGRDVTRALRELEGSCRSDRNIMPAMMEAVGADATLGEIGDVFRDVFGDWKVPISF